MRHYYALLKNVFKPEKAELCLRIVFTDKSSVSRNRTVMKQNTRIWARGNPYEIQKNNYQRKKGECLSRNSRIQNYQFIGISKMNNAYKYLKLLQVDIGSILEAYCV